MSRTVCSWCKAPLVLKDDILVCSNTDCPACDEKYLHEALNRTRKALEIAVDALKSAHEYYEYCVEREKQPYEEVNWDCTAMNMDNDISEVLEQITALEQKD